jgi:hypothetical protein
VLLFLSCGLLSLSIQFWWLMCSGFPVVGDILLLLLSVYLFGGRISSVVVLSPCTVLAGLNIPLGYICLTYSTSTLFKMCLHCRLSRCLSIQWNILAPS